MEDKKIIGQKIRMFRKSMRKSQREMAEELNLHPQYISDWENGKRLVSFSALLAIAREYKISLSNFDPPLNERV